MTTYAAALRTLVLVLLLFALKTARGVENGDSSDKSRAKRIVAAPLRERLAEAYPSWSTEPRLLRVAVDNDFRKEVVEARDRFMQRLAAWPSGPNQDPKAEVLVFEIAAAQDANPIGRYERVVLGCGDDKVWAAFEKIDTRHPTRLDSRSWKLIRPYVRGAAAAGTVGKLSQRISYGFDVVLLAYFDGREWHCSNYREYVLHGPADTPGVKKLFRLADVLYGGLDIKEAGFAGFDNNRDVSKTVKKLRAIREESRIQHR